MKIIKLIIAVLAALWTVGVAIGVVSELGTHGGTRGVVNLAAGLGVTAGLTAVTIWLFQWALRDPNAPAVRPAKDTERESDG